MPLGLVGSTGGQNQKGGGILDSRPQIIWFILNQILGVSNGVGQPRKSGGQTQSMRFQVARDGVRWFCILVMKAWVHDQISGGRQEVNYLVTGSQVGRISWTGSPVHWPHFGPPGSVYFFGIW